MGWSKLDNDMALNQELTITSFCEKVNFENTTSIVKESDLDLLSAESSEVLTTQKQIPPLSKIIITIPAYNEEDAIGKIILRIKKTMDKTKYRTNYLVLVVNDGSSDRTAEKATHAGAFVFSNEINLGLAQTFQIEMKICLELGADIIVHTDADGQYIAEEIPLLIEQVENGNDLVLGSRFKGTIESMSLLKRFGNVAFSIIISLLTGRNISDGQTGFRAFTRKVADKIPIISDHTYTQEQIIRASKMNFKISEIPIRFAKRNNGKSRLIRNPFEYAVRAWKDIFRIFLRKD